MTSRVHRIAVAALVRNGGEVLLVHRHPRRAAYPNCWDLVGGHVEADETPEDALRRECREEIGVEIMDPRPVSIAVSNPDIVLYGFVVTRWSGHPQNLAPAEHDDLRWFRPDDLPGMVMADAASLPDILAAVQSVASRASG